jgi:hypothetical protein
MSQQEFLEIKKAMATKVDGKLILSAKENLRGAIVDVKQSLPSALDFARLEGRIEVVERKLGISTTTS